MRFRNPEGVMSGSLPSPVQQLAGPLLLAAACVLAGEPPPATDKGKQPQAARVELHRLDNDDLLKRATGIYDKAARDYLAVARALAAAELMVHEATQPEGAGATKPEKEAATAEEKDP